MKKVPAVRAVENLGLDGDRHAHANGSRQVLLMPLEVIEKLGIEIGDVKENITTRGIDVLSLPKGTHLLIGDAIFETTRACEPCERMDEIRRGLREELTGQRGMLARVIRGGEILVGDAIRILEHD